VGHSRASAKSCHGIAVGLKPSALGDEGRLRGLRQAAQAAFNLARDFSRRATGFLRTLH